MAEESSSRASGAIGPTLIVMLSGLLVYFTHEPILESQRPNLTRQAVPPPPAIAGLNAIHSRLWDDPLVVAYRDSERSQQEFESPTKLLKKAFESACVEKLEPDKVFEQVVSKSIGENNGEKTLLCMPMLVPGEPYDNDTELRKRITYATLSALTACGYQLDTPDRVSYVEVPVIVRVSGIEKNKKIDKFVVPVKLFRRSDVEPELPEEFDRPDFVVVLWINEDQLGKLPLAAIGQILEKFFGKLPDDQKKRLELRMLGPTDSNTLLDMANDDAACFGLGVFPGQFSTIFQKGAFLVCSRATISASALEWKSRSKLIAFTESPKSQSGMSVVRTIGSDWQLARKLIEELGLRIDPTAGRGIHDVVLITESDTLYGSEFAEVLKRALPPKFDRLHIFKYLRGLDGKIPNDRGQTDESRGEETRSKDSEAESSHANQRESILASGPSQFDYLRRLEQTLVELDQERKNKGEQGIKAIGVIGTDVYDKLLVLRALRKRFPQTWFFTTDLDAALSLPAEYSTAHNLLVASHFGLTLNPEIQLTSFPFRDGYQTSTYVSALWALNHPVVKKAMGDVGSSPGPTSEPPWKGDPWHVRYETVAFLKKGMIDPLVFEVGRSGPYQLTIPGNKDVKLQPSGLRGTHWLLENWHWLKAVLLVGLIFIGIIWFFLEDFRAVARVLGSGSPSSLAAMIFVVLCLIFVPALIGVAVTDHTCPNGEPFVLFEGISIWPSTLLRAFVGIFSLVFTIIIFHNMPDGPLRKLDNDQRTKIARSSPSKECWKSVRDFLNSNSWRPWTIFCTFVAVVLGNDQKTKIAASAPRETCGEAVRDYLDSNLWCPWTIAKVSLSTIVAVAFSYLLLYISESPFLPYRGPLSKMYGLAMLMFASISMLFLTSTVIICVDSCCRLIKKLGGTPARWSQTEIDQFKKDYKTVAPEDLGELLTIQVIAATTRVVGESIKFPFIVLFLLILSRHPIFDMLELPWSLVLLWSLLVASLTWVAHRLRQDAREARDKVIGRLRASLSACHGERRVRQLKQYIAEIESEDGGAFQPLTRDPLVQALAFGASGGMLLLQHLLPF